jgi:hypothetical protein
VTREQRLTAANTAMKKATNLAQDAEHHARSGESCHKAETLAAAGALWVSIALAHADIANLLPETESPDA